MRGGEEDDSHQDFRVEMFQPQSVIEGDTGHRPE